MTSPRETAFRNDLRQWAATWWQHLPSTLCDDIADHLSRTDTQGYSLCFDGPQRERLLGDLQVWLAKQPQTMQEAAWAGLDALIASQLTITP